MRDKKYLKYFDDIATLLKYLYLDSTISVAVEYNGTQIFLRMSEDGRLLYDVNNNDSKKIRIEDLGLDFWYKAVDSLKDKNNPYYDGSFKNWWDEIINIVDFSTV